MANLIRLFKAWCGPGGVRYTTAVDPQFFPMPRCENCDVWDMVRVGRFIACPQCDHVPWR